MLTKSPPPFPPVPCGNGTTTTTTTQDHRYSYTAVRDRKRRDRALQALLIGTVVAGVGKAALWAGRTAVRLLVKA